jgi:hypothetical protein
MSDYAGSVVNAKSPGVAACGDDSSPDAKLPPSGIPMTPATVPAGIDAGTTPSGAQVYKADGGIITILTTDDAGRPILPDDVFGLDLLTNANGNVYFNKYQGANGILFESPMLSGKNLQAVKLELKIASDSTKINYMPATGCYPGLIKITPAPVPAVACPEPGYEYFLSCPSDENSRVAVFVENVTLTGYQKIGGEFVPVGEPVVLKYTDLNSGIDAGTNPQVNWANGYQLPLSCASTAQAVDGGSAPKTLPAIPVPASFVSDGTLYFTVKLDLLAQANNFVPQALYLTKLNLTFNQVASQ